VKYWGQRSISISQYSPLLTMNEFCRMITNWLLKYLQCKNPICEQMCNCVIRTKLWSRFNDVMRSAYRIVWHCTANIITPISQTFDLDTTYVPGRVGPGFTHSRVTRPTSPLVADWTNGRAVSISGCTAIGPVQCYQCWFFPTRSGCFWLRLVVW